MYELASKFGLDSFSPNTYKHKTVRTSSNPLQAESSRRKA